MKIGILTYHRALNYGAVLQCMSLYLTLKGMGHDVEIIDYRPAAIEKYRMFFRWKDFVQSVGVLGKLRYLGSCCSLIGSRKKTVRKFDGFIAENLKVSHLVTSTKDVPDDYDVIFFGSDQIWNPSLNEGIDNVYLGHFPKHHAKLFSYAVSIGRLDLIEGKVAEDYSQCLHSLCKRRFVRGWRLSLLMKVMSFCSTWMVILMLWALHKMWQIN